MLWAALWRGLHGRELMAPARGRTSWPPTSFVSELERGSSSSQAWGECKQEDSLIMTSQAIPNHKHPVSLLLDFWPTKMCCFKLLNLDKFVTQAELANTILLEYERQAEQTKNQVDCKSDCKCLAFHQAWGLSESSNARQTHHFW